MTGPIAPTGGTLAGGTFIPTPTGWLLVDQLDVGTEVFDHLSRTTVISYVGPLVGSGGFLLSFDDDTRVLGGPGLRLQVLSGNGRSLARQTVPAHWLSTRVFDSHGVRTHRVLNAGPLQTDWADLLIHGYVLGAWLGDGKHSAGEVTKNDPEVFEQMETFGYRVGGNISGRESVSRTVYGLVTQLRAAGVLRNKHVPSSTCGARPSSGSCCCRG